MILVAFVLVILAAVTLLYGVFLADTNELAFIWASIIACVATFGVLGLSWMSRRRQAASPAAPPEPLGGGAVRPAPVRAAPRATTVGEESIADRILEDTEPDVTVTIRSGATEVAPEPAQDETQVMEPVVIAEPEPEPEPEAAPQPAPRPVAPRRVVRKAPEPIAEAPEPEARPAPTPAPRPAAQRPTTQRVVRRTAPAAGAAAGAAAASTTQRVVRRPAADGGGAAPQPAGTRTVRRVARPAAEGQQPTTVRRVVKQSPPTTRTVVQRRPAASSAAPAPAAAAKPAAAKRTAGTRGAAARAALGEIKGVGPAKQEALLREFGSLEKIGAASIEELTSVRGVGEQVAAELKRQFG